MSRDEEVQSARATEEQTQDSEVEDNPDAEPEPTPEDASNSRSSRILRLLEKLKTDIQDYDHAQTQHYRVRKLSSSS